MSARMAAAPPPARMKPCKPQQTFTSHSASLKADPHDTLSPPDLIWRCSRAPDTASGVAAQPLCLFACAGEPLLLGLTCSRGQGARSAPPPQPLRRRPAAATTLRLAPLPCASAAACCLLAAMATKRLLRVLADRPETLAALLRGEETPTLLHTAAVCGDVELVQVLLAYDSSLALLGLKEPACSSWWDRPPATALAAAVAALQPAVIPTLLPASWPPRGTDSDTLLTAAAFQVSHLARLLQVITRCHGKDADVFSSYCSAPPQPQPQPPAADWRQRVEATLAALLEGPHGGCGRPCGTGYWGLEAVPQRPVSGSRSLGLERVLALSSPSQCE